MVIAVGLDRETVRRGRTSPLQQLAALAREELICVLPVEGCGGAPPGAALRALAQAAGTGVSVRLLCSPGALLSAEGRGFLRAGAPGDIQARAATAPLGELLLVDGQVALVRSQPARTPAVLRLLREMFTAAWESAIPAADYRWLGTRADDRLTGQILGSLRAGYKDDVAARKLGLSVRTYRRYVADLLRNMGAETRFQAGARAAELGLLSPGN
jgi:hypothetical protein